MISGARCGSTTRSTASLQEGSQGRYALCALVWCGVVPALDGAQPGGDPAVVPPRLRPRHAAEHEGAPPPALQRRPLPEPGEAGGGRGGGGVGAAEVGGAPRGDHLVPGVLGDGRDHCRGGASIFIIFI